MLSGELHVLLKDYCKEVIRDQMLQQILIVVYFIKILNIYLSNAITFVRDGLGLVADTFRTQPDSVIQNLQTLNFLTRKCSFFALFYLVMNVNHV